MYSQKFKVLRKLRLEKHTELGLTSLLNVMMGTHWKASVRFSARRTSAGTLLCQPVNSVSEM